MDMIDATAEHEHATARRRRGSVCAAGAAAALLAAGPSDALEWGYTPVATVGALHDTNMLFEFDGAKPVNGRTVMGVADVVGRNEGFEFRATPRVDAWRYDDPAVQDRNDQYADVSVAVHDARQRWSFGGNYALEGTRNSAFESNGFAGVDFDRKQTGLSTSWTRLVERGQFDLAASATSVDYQDSPFSPYRDYRYDVLQGDYSRTTSERSRWGFSLNRSEVSTDRGLITTTSTDARATWTHEFSASLEAHIGLGLLESTTDGVVSRTESAPALDFNITQTWPRWRLAFFGGRQLMPDGQGSLLREDRLQVDAVRRVTEALNLILAVAKTQDEYLASFYDRDFWQEAVTVQWRFKRRWIVEGSVTDRGQQWVTLGLPSQTGVVTQFSISYRGG
jgi:hypothetical protein